MKVTAMKKIAAALGVVGLIGWLRDYYWTKKLCKTLQKGVALRDEHIKQLQELDKLKDKVSEMQVRAAYAPGGMMNPIVVSDGDEEDAPE